MFEHSQPQKPRGRRHSYPPCAIDELWFAAILFVSFVWYIRLSGDHWFAGDEWYFLVDRSASVPDLMAHHNGHPVFLPLLAFRALYNVVGLRSYYPYSLITISLHLIAAALIRTLAMRSGANRAAALAVGAIFAGLGTASQNILSSFQMTLSGSLVLGLWACLRADSMQSEPHSVRRDFLTSAVLTAAIACSALGGVLMVVAAAIAWLRRGWSSAVRVAAAPGLALAAWSLAYGPSPDFVISPLQHWRWSSQNARELFTAMGPRHSGWLFALVLGAGGLIGWRSRPTRFGRYQRFRRQPVALAVALLAIGSTLFWTSTLLTRRYILSLELSSIPDRYVHISAALVLPAVAVALSAIGRAISGDTFRRVAGAAALCAFAILFLTNLLSASNDDGVLGGSAYEFRSRLVAYVNRPEARALTDDFRPEPYVAPSVTMGWLRQVARQGRLPDEAFLSPQTREAVRLRLLLVDRLAPGQMSCRQKLSADQTLKIRLEKGTSIEVLGPVAVRLMPPSSRVASEPVWFGGSLLTGYGRRLLLADRVPLNLQISARLAGAIVCPSPGGRAAPAGSTDSVVAPLRAEPQPIGSLDDAVVRRSRAPRGTRLVG